MKIEKRVEAHTTDKDLRKSVGIQMHQVIQLRKGLTRHFAGASFTSIEPGFLLVQQDTVVIEQNPQSQRI